MNNSPSVLFVDDEPDGPPRSMSHELSDRGVSSLVLTPGEVTLDHIDDADLVLVDYQIENWSARDQAPELGLRPPDGLALAAIFRQSIQYRKDARPTGFALMTAQMSLLASPWPRSTNREHLLANMNSLEWVFEKTDELVVEKVVSLAKTIADIPDQWSDSGLDSLMALMRVAEDHPQREQILDDVLRCSPPIHDLRHWSHGIALVRWMLQRVLPYPCFLLDPHRLCARLGVDLERFSKHLDEDTDFRRKFASCEYKGMLHGFKHPLWWKAMVESLLWEETNKKSYDALALNQFVKSVIGQDPPQSKWKEDPIVCYDADYLPQDTFVSFDRAVRLRPDNWPSYAEPCWALIDQVNDKPELRAIVDPEDIERLDTSDH